jgi:hypothetical protein
VNNNFDELILKRRARGRARMASMGAHVSWGAKGGCERLGGVDGGRERGGANGRGARGARGPWGTWGRERGGAWGRGGRTAVGRARPRAPTAEGALSRAHPTAVRTYVRAPRWRRVRGAHARGPCGSWGRVRTCLPMGARTSQVRRV